MDQFNKKNSDIRDQFLISYRCFSCCYSCTSGCSSCRLGDLFKKPNYRGLCWDIFMSESQFSYLFTLKNAHLSSNSYNFWIKQNIAMTFAGYVAWILLCKYYKFGERIYYNSRAIQFFLRDYFFGAPCRYVWYFHDVACSQCTWPNLYHSVRVTHRSTCFRLLAFSCLIHCS